MKCIYSIVSLNDGRRYIGSAEHFFHRRNRHISDLRLGRHHNKFLQRAWNKYGEKAFRFGILSVVDSSEQLVQTEQAWIDGYDPEYNECKVAGSPLGTKGSKWKSLRMTWSNMGRTVSKETREKMSRSHTGQKRTEAHKELMRQKMLGRVFSESHRKNMSEAKKHPSAKAKENLRAAAIKRMKSPELRARISASLRAYNADRIRSRGGCY